MSVSSTLATTVVESLRTRLQGGSFQLWSGDPSAGGTLRTTHAIPGSIDAAASGSVTFTPAAAYPVNVTTPVVPTHWRIVDNVGAGWSGAFDDLFTAPATLVDGGLVTLDPVSVALPGFEPVLGPVAPLVTWTEGEDGNWNSQNNRSGATEYYACRAGYFEWVNASTGDWLDSTLTAQGTTPWAVLTGTTGDAGSYVEADVTSLVNAWINGNLEYHGFQIGPAAVAPSCTWSSREGANPPQLVIDGGTAINPTADAYVINSAYSYGEELTLLSSTSRFSLLKFDLSALTAPVTSATLRLYLESRFSSGGDDTVVNASAPHHTVTVPAAITGIAASYPGDVGIDADPAVIKHETFADNTWSLSLADWQTAGGPASGKWVRTGSDIEIGAAVTGGNATTGWRVANNVLECSFDPDDVRGGNANGLRLGTSAAYPFFKPSEPSELYVRFYVMFGDGNQSDIEAGPFRCVDAGGKIGPGVCGTYVDDFGGQAGHPYGITSGGAGGNCPTGSNGWSNRNDFRSVNRNSTSPLEGSHTVGAYLYTMDACQVPGTATQNSKADNTGGTMVSGRWYCVEQYVKVNAAGSADGRIRMWIDGVEQYDSDNDSRFDGVGVRFHNDANIGIDRVWLDCYYGGQTVGAGPEYRQSVFIRDVVIATAPIGPKV
jgi:hypothetical protein